MKTSKFLILIVNNDRSDSYAVPVRTDVQAALRTAVGIALPDDGARLAYGVVTATDAGAARLMRPRDWTHTTVVSVCDSCECYPHASGCTRVEYLGESRPLPPVANVRIAGTALVLIDAISHRELATIDGRKLARTGQTGRAACEAWCSANGYTLRTDMLR